MLHAFNLYDLFVLCFVQLMLSTVLVLSPARGWAPGCDGPARGYRGRRGRRWRRRRCRPSPASSPPNCGDLPLRPALETAAYLLTVFCVVVIVLRPDCNVVGQVFYASYAAAGFTFLAFAALVAAAATHSIVEALTASLVILLDLGGLRRVDLEHQLRERRPVPHPAVAAAARGRPRLPAHGVAAHPGLQRAPRAADRDHQGGRADRLPRLRGGRHGQQHQGPGRLGPGGGVLPGPRPGPVRPRRTPGRATRPAPATWPCAATPTRGPRSSAWSTPTTSSSRTTCARPSPTSPTPDLGFVQTFEGNRDYEGSAYYTACVDSYQGFYLAIMSVAQRAGLGALRGHDGAVPPQRPDRASAAGTNGASARTPRPRSGC